MRYALVELDGHPTLCARQGERYFVIDTEGEAPGSVLARFLASPMEASTAVAEATRKGQGVDAASAKLLPPICGPGTKVLCLGLNYVDHAAEASYQKPEYPVVFARFPESFVGHREPIDYPARSTMLDYEAEMVAVIGKGGRRISKEQALEHVAGFTLMNDGSVRDVQTHTHQWMLGKNFDRSGSLGPEIVTADELPRGGSGLMLSGRLNGEVMQQMSTADMIFDLATQVAYVSEAVELRPGDLIATGTPAGVGHARKPPVYMKPGDVFEVEVERLGVLSNRIGA